ncbi:MAG: glycosyltransferase [Paracoccaceae bacterium]
MGVVCLASQDWNSHLGVPQQIMGRVVAEVPVVYIDPPRSITSRLQGWESKAQDPVRHMDVAQSVDVARRAAPARALPVHNLPVPVSRLLRGINGLSMRNWFRSILAEQGEKQPLYWVFEPASIQHLPHLPKGPVVYDCIDYWAGYFPEGSRRHTVINQMDQAMAERADVVFAGSDMVFERHKAFNAQTHLIRHAADFGHFNSAASDSAGVHTGLQHLSDQKVIGLCGILDKRVDVVSMAAIAARRPDWHLVFVGPVQDNLDVSAFDGLPNVTLTGMADVSDLPLYIKGFDVCLIPYLIDEFVRGIYPLKLHEYLATGKPVVSTPIPAVMPHSDLVWIAEGADKLEQAIEQAMQDNDPDRVAARIALARDNNWEGRVEDKLNVIRERIGDGWAQN